MLRDKGSWNSISQALAANKIGFTKAKNTRDGILVQVPTSGDHRLLTRLLDERKVEYYHWELPEDRRLRVVIRGVPKELDSAEIMSDLKAQSLPVHEVHRMYGRGKRVIYDMILVILDLSPEGKKIFNITAICQISGLKIEKPYKKSSPTQCHNCQSYGHSSRNCHVRARCVKCLGDHHTHDCPRPKDPKECTEAPGCVLCGTLGHTASYGGCPQRPRNRRAPKSKPSQQQTSSSSIKKNPSPQAPLAALADASVATPPNAWVRPPTIASQGPRQAPSSSRMNAPSRVVPPPPATCPPSLGPSPLSQSSLPSPRRDNGDPNRDFQLAITQLSERMLLIQQNVFAQFHHLSSELSALSNKLSQ
ncbi:hypothetical protein JYU34_018314 [Plutella xylostella]|uniref:Pre-C2HC domain-containing protein n=1 Tax=Plutella xylostella TaxID=51655 RepID=A0ABQ7Q097_PLUXY|nr:hypothetical protein JYU34_018314 [Plutella xylostella]